MPLPKPNKGESEKDFVDRCMGDEITKKDFPDEKQRLAVCYKQIGRSLEDTPEPQPEDLEERVSGQRLEIRVEPGHAPRLVGYAAVFNSPSLDLGGFTEYVRPGAFSESLKGQPDVRAFLNHDPNMILGRSKAGTLRMHEDNHGLWVEITPGDTTLGRDTLENVRLGNLDGMSFAFQTPKGGDRWDANYTTRELLGVNLKDVSVVAFPAYPKTEVALRSLVAARQAESARDAALRLETAKRRLRLEDLR